MLKRTIISALVTSVITAMIIGGVIFNFIDTFDTPYMYVSVDINPSVGLQLNKRNQVINVVALNEDAHLLTLSDLDGMDVVDAINAITVDADAHDFISKDSQIYITAVAIESYKDSYDAFKARIFDEDEMSVALSYADVSFAEVDASECVKSESIYTALTTNVEAYNYIDIVAKKVPLATNRQLIQARPENENADIIVEIEKFIELIESTYPDVESSRENFISSVKMSMNDVDADYHDIYCDVVAYWDSLNEKTQVEVILTSEEMDEDIALIEEQTIALSPVIVTEVATIEAIEKTDNNDVLVTSVLDTEVTTEEAYDTYEVSPEKEDALSHAGAVDDFFYKAPEDLADKLEVTRTEEVEENTME